MKGPILLSLCHDPAWNLALEEALTEQGHPLLFLWQNEPSVILGRNQNPWEECDPALLKEKSVHLVRRKSGGGAVYHDLGNLNITLLSEKTPGVLGENMEFFCSILRSLGIPAAPSGRNDVEVEGKKVSGTAFYETDRCLCHHGTLLISSDFTEMPRCLTPSPLKLEAKGIRSVSARVGNLRDWVPGITVEAVIEAFCRAWGGTPIRVSRQQLEAYPTISAAAARYAGPAWTFGETPRYDLQFCKKFPWGLAEAQLAVDHGLVSRCRIFTDSLDPGGFDALADSLVGLPFPGDEFQNTAGALAPLFTL